MKFTKSLRPSFLQNTSTLMAAFGSKPMKTYTKVYPAKKGNDIPEQNF